MRERPGSKHSAFGIRHSELKINPRGWNLTDFRVVFFLLLAAFCLLPANAAFAQDDDSWRETAPPPLKILSKAEKTQLEGVTDVKQRTKLGLELMDARLLKAEEYNSKEQFPEMFLELGSFHALVDDTLEFLDDNNNNGGKVLNNFKRIELSLRKYINRLELIRRDLPIKYELYVRKLVGRIRDARTRAVEPLFDDTVVPDKKPV